MSKNFMKPCDISLYNNNEAKTLKKEPAASEPGPIYSSLLTGVGTVRQGVQEAWSQLKDVRTATEEIYETGKAHTQGTLDQLRADENQALRAGVIAGGGLVGLLFGMMRGRFIKRLFYTGLGAGSAAAVCYPNEATSLSKEAYTEAQRLGYIAYNFVTGVQPASKETSPDPAEVVKALSDEDKQFFSSTVTTQDKPSDDKPE